ncbi:MAG TPA: hypothetical protein VEP90_04350 [Methylomirabilota bacterium]|nr:hypothetical protein [Methylomirabilota bacterium]
MSTQPDIRAILGSSLWKQSGGLIIPSYLTKIMLSPVDVSGVVYLTHKEILGHKYTREELEKDLSQLSVEDCIVFTSRILTVLENEGLINTAVQQGITQELFEGEIRRKILTILSREPRKIIFFKTQLLLVAKYALLYAKNEPANNFMDRELFPIYMQVVLGMTDLFADATESSSLAELQREAIRSMYFFSKPEFFYSLGRTQDLFIHIPQELIKHRQYLDILALFQEATGLTLENYLILGTSLTALLMQQKLGHTQDTNWYITPERFFAESIVPNEEVQLLMAEFTTDVETLQALFKRQGNFEYNFDGLVQRPLVTYDKHSFFPLDFTFMKDKITLQVYWILFDHIKNRYGDEKLTQYTNFMGICFEEYVHRLLRRIYPSSPSVENRLLREFAYSPKKSEKKRTVDNILINRSSLILIETKVSQLKVSTGVAGDLDAFREDIRKIVVKAFKQIQRTKEDFQKGLLHKDLPVEPTSITTFYPVVITYGMFVMFPLVWTIVEEEIQKVPNYDPELLSRLQIIQADEIEVLEAFLTTSGISFEALLSMKIADDIFRLLPFHTYLSHKFKIRQPLASKYQEQQIEQFADKVALKIFGQKRPREKEDKTEEPAEQKAKELTQQ